MSVTAPLPPSVSALSTAARWDGLVAVVGPQLSPAAKLRREEPLGPKTTMRVGGAARVYAEPASETDILISEAYRWAFERGQRFGYAAAYSVLIFAFLLLYGRLTERVSKST